MNNRSHNNLNINQSYDSDEIKENTNLSSNRNEIKVNPVKSKNILDFDNLDNQNFNEGNDSLNENILINSRYNSIGSDEIRAKINNSQSNSSEDDRTRVVDSINFNYEHLHGIVNNNPHSDRSSEDNYSAETTAMRKKSISTGITFKF